MSDKIVTGRMEMWATWGARDQLESEIRKYCDRYNLELDLKRYYAGFLTSEYLIIVTGPERLVRHLFAELRRISD